MRTSSTASVALLLAFVMGCYGGLDPQGEGQTAGDETGDGGESGDAEVPVPIKQLIPARVRRLSRTEYRAALAALVGDEVSTPTLPGDSVINGYDNKADTLRVTSVMVQTLWAATPSLAAQLASDLVDASPCSGGDELACARALLTDIARRAYRRPVTDDEVATLLEVFEVGRDGASYEAGIALALRVVLQSPEFLYRTEIGEGEGTQEVRLTEHEIAQALSFGITGGPPDDELAALADAGGLVEADIRVAQAERLLATPAAARAMGEFAERWLGTYEVLDTDRDPEMYPQWETSRDGVASEVRRFVAAAVLEQGATFSALLSADWTVIDETMVAYYGDAGPGQIQRPAGRHAGVLALPGFLAAHAQSQDPSPVQRGHFVRTRLLCQEIPPPPNDVSVAPPPPDPSLSNRERWFQKTSSESCSGCHQLMDPLGYAFEGFDAIGQWRTEDAGAPVDASGALTGTDVDASFEDLEGLAGLLASSQDARRCFAANWLEYSLGRVLSGDELAGVEEAVGPFVADDLAITDLMVEVIASDIFVWRGPST